MENNVNGKVILISGASSGMGEALAKQLAKQGAKLILAARREEKLKKLTEEIRKENGEAHYIVTDVSVHSDVENMVKFSVETYGKIDVLVNNAAIMPSSFLYKNNYREWDSLIDINIKGVLYAVGEILPHMRNNKKGHIINVSSVAAHTDINPYCTVYAMTKKAVKAISDGLRQEEAIFKSNIRVTDMAPGAIDTDLKYTVTDPEMKEAVMAAYADNMPKLSAGDMARAIVYVINEPDNIVVNEIVVRPVND